jgi:HPt (histidine-containing phosphotransfer) domain-containing protein
MTMRLVVLDPEALAMLRECDPDGTLLPELVELFRTETPRRIATLRAAHTAGNPVALTQEAHALKSGCAQLGARQMSDLCQRLEIQGRIGSMQAAGALLDELDREFTAVTEALLAQLR